MSNKSQAPSASKPGSFAPLGALSDGQGTNFALFSVQATSVDLCLFDDAGREERVPLTEVDSLIWHTYLPGIRPGQRYGYRVDGPWDLRVLGHGQKCVSRQRHTLLFHCGQGVSMSRRRQEYLC